MKLSYVFLIAALACLPAAAKAAQKPQPAYTSVTDLANPVDAALAAHAQGRRVLVVFDIDNTLLTMPQDLGSDTWFNWQQTRDKSEAGFQALLLNNTALLQLSTLSPTQPDAAQQVRRLQTAGIAVYALSARGSDLRGATEAALKANGIDLSSAPECGPPLCVRRGNLGDAEIRRAAKRARISVQTKPYRPVTVSDGVMMLSGQDKGVMLGILLKSLKGHRYTDVYFVDDTFQNVRNVQAAAPEMKADIHLYSYERLWPATAAFMADPARQTKTDSDFKAVRDSLCNAIRATLCVTPFHMEPVE
ncbi:hypothetical protein AEAC466_06950 [Asticcacaulis sp. AC466]|uniref:DUF2608 domain-containing protein n=1 Tax=Asticcacaulis sp. AC466 TaxID=1282362 RepID=UPI0003C3D6FF|nr:DUF2608 domain-containing protein [Asticcacaulis sp. AC466]ESQ84788.1 hypothetical protein AEAC466_06950 [Asticcacaulis sp. AC466]